MEDANPQYNTGSSLGSQSGLPSHVNQYEANSQYGSNSPASAQNGNANANASNIKDQVVNSEVRDLPQLAEEHSN